MSCQFVIDVPLTGPVLGINGGSFSRKETSHGDKPGHVERDASEGPQVVLLELFGPAEQQGYHSGGDALLHAGDGSSGAGSDSDTRGGPRGSVRFQSFCLGEVVGSEADRGKDSRFFRGIDQAPPVRFAEPLEGRVRVWEVLLEFVSSAGGVVSGGCLFIPLSF